MATTYKLISSNVLGSSTSSVTFSSIPSTYTDLCIKANLRSDDTSFYDQLLLRLNGDTATNYSDTYMSGLGSGGSNSSRSSNSSAFFVRFTDANTATSNTFSNMEMYLSSYASSQYKTMANYSVEETNTDNARLATSSHYYRSTTPISSISFAPTAGANWVAGSSFYLYGIKNS